MLLLIFVIGAILLGAGIFIYSRYGQKLYLRDKEWVYVGLNIAGAVVMGISLMIGIIVGGELTQRLVIDDTIALYTTENTKIEQQISTLVDGYMQHEANTYKEFKNESPEVLVSLFPELKSDALVKQQIDLYIYNNAQIKALESRRISLRMYAWWLYFGK